MKTGSGVPRCFLAFALSLFFLVLSSWSSQVMAADYEEANLNNIVKTMVRYGAVNIKDDLVIDNFARLEECEIFKHYYSDEFKWNKIRPKIRESIRNKVATYPTGYYFDADFQLGKYDFKDKKYVFDGNNPIKNFNVFNIKVGKNDRCDGKGTDFFSDTYRLVLDKSFQLQGIPLSEGEAKILLDHMEQNNNSNRVISARFNMRVMFIAILTYEEGESGKNSGSLVQSRKDKTVRFDMRLDSVDFYEDEAKTKLIYSYRP